MMVSLWKVWGGVGVGVYVGRCCWLLLKAQGFTQHHILPGVFLSFSVVLDKTSMSTTCLSYDEGYLFEWYLIYVPRCHWSQCSFHHERWCWKLRGTCSNLVVRREGERRLTASDLTDPKTLSPWRCNWRESANQEADSCKWSVGGWRT